MGGNEKGCDGNCEDGELTGMAEAMALYITFIHVKPFSSSTGRRPQGRCAEDFCCFHQLISRLLQKRAQLDKCYQCDRQGRICLSIAFFTRYQKFSTSHSTS
ncbi:hypothetical protein PGT21_032433 [Puccinia graminis f. sp. tritici]|uniref:Uncharacterized protein n=1 Tax=Puccinia graminis f. sp. tritici TaxID=56615 RepID=A0A5B0R428_PUCGR|nr:hypothetical protein PGT21_032433 [Puccinia graminis f. sp. tritici]